MKKLAIIDDSYKEVFERDMRVYLVKTEEEFTQFALMKNQEEIKLAKAGPQSSPIRSNQRGNTGKTQACSDKSIQRSGQKLQGRVGNNAQRQNKTANEVGSSNLKGAIVKQHCNTNVGGELSSIIDNLVTAGTSSMGILQLSSVEADSATLVSHGNNSNFVDDPHHTQDD